MSVATDSQDAGESLLVFRNAQGTECRGMLMSVSRHVVVFEVYNPYSIVQLSEVLNDLRIRRGDRTVYNGKAVVSNLVNTGLMLIVSATLVDAWSNLNQLSPGGGGIRSEVTNFVQDWDHAQSRLRQTYQHVVSRFRNFLEELSRWLGQGETVAGITDPGTPETYKREFVNDVITGVSPKLWQLMSDFEGVAKEVPFDTTTIHKSFARREIHPLIMCSPFLHRTFTKPLGYAGDYEMVNMILSDPIAGANTYAKIINVLNLNGAAAVAHRNRIDMLIGYLEEHAKRCALQGRKLNVLNIACGPAVEVQRFAKSSSMFENCHFTLLDFNSETLTYATTHIEDAAASANRKAHIECIHKSIHELLKETSSRHDAQRAEPVYDLVYCAGLFDYLSDKICQRLVRLFATFTKPGGTVLVTNVHSNNPNKLYMEHILEWHLNHRNEEQMLALAPKDCPSELKLDHTNVNIFLEVHKPSLQLT